MIARLVCLAALVLPALVATEVQVAVATYVRAVDADIRALRSLEIIWENTRVQDGAPGGRDRVRSLYAGGRMRIEHLMLTPDGQVLGKTLKAYDGATAYSLDCIGRLMTLTKGLSFEPMMEPPQLFALLPATGLGSRGNPYRAPIPTGPDLLPALHLDGIFAEPGGRSAATVKILTTVADLIMPPGGRQHKIPANLKPSTGGRMFTWNWNAAKGFPSGASKATFGPNKTTPWYTIAFKDMRPLRTGSPVAVPFAAHIDYFDFRTGQLSGTWDITTTSIEVDRVVDDEEFVIEPSLADSIWDADAQAWISSHADR